MLLLILCLSDRSGLIYTIGCLSAVFLSLSHLLSECALIVRYLLRCSSVFTSFFRFCLASILCMFGVEDVIFPDSLRFSLHLTTNIYRTLHICAIFVRYSFANAIILQCDRAFRWGRIDEISPT